MSDLKTLTALERDALNLLRELCFDRGVILYATCVDDSREALYDLLRKYELPLTPLAGYRWQRVPRPRSQPLPEPPALDDDEDFQVP